MQRLTICQECKNELNNATKSTRHSALKTGVKQKKFYNASFRDGGTEEAPNWFVSWFS